MRTEIKDNKKIETDYGDDGDPISQQIYHLDSDRVDCTIYPRGLIFNGEANLYESVFSIKGLVSDGFMEIAGRKVPIYKRA